VINMLIGNGGGGGSSGIAQQRQAQRMGLA